MSTELLVFNGIDGATGHYLAPPLTPAELSGLIQRELAPIPQLDELRAWSQQASRRHLGVKEGVDPRRLAEAGWGVIFAQDADPAIREALTPLLDHRRAQATRQAEGRYQEYQGATGYRPGESKFQFLSRQGVGPGPVDPDQMPYYLLIIGEPESIPYTFQYQLDVQYAVGRLAFATPEEYACYAQSVVTVETQAAIPRRRITFFAAANPDDRATQLSTQELVAPLAAQLGQLYAGWEMETVLGGAASKARLAEVLNGPLPPALLFTASHGLAFPSGHPRQTRQQGALLCQDWPGPLAWQTAIPEDFYFSADDVTSSAARQGLITFHFACYGAGTPQRDTLAPLLRQVATPIAPYSFVASLPQRLLGQPQGGALAIIGHVDRTWGFSFLWQGAGRQLEVFISTFQRLLTGYPIGAAMEYFNLRYAELATSLGELLSESDNGMRTDPLLLAALWTAYHDARSYVILGDPAVRLTGTTDNTAA